ncbi:MAG: hypothetical protein CL946_10510 [Ectothiorhodospiraceae bacterium]|nr:hypothetical protein [Ectothiorhodospiraceae bacterium]
MALEAIENLVDLLDEYSKQDLKDKENFKQFLQLAHEHDRTEIIRNMAFHSKYLWKLYGTIRKQAPDSEHYEKLEREFAQTVEEFHGQINSLIEGVESEFTEMVNRHYLAISEQSLKHLLTLANDFYWLKNWELEMEQLQQESGEDTDTSQETTGDNS